MISMCAQKSGTMKQPVKRRENFQEYVSWQWHCNEHEDEGKEDDNVVMYIINVVCYISPSSSNASRC